jgi:microcystin-dependent protein
MEDAMTRRVVCFGAIAAALFAGSAFAQNLNVTGTTTTQNLTVTGAASVPGLVPTGAVIPFAGSTPPAGWILADGSSKLRAEYPALFAVISTTYGAVDGTHFTLPNLCGRVPVGAGTPATPNGTTVRTLAGTGGQESVRLTADQSGTPAHSHGVSDPGHVHTSNMYHDVFGTTGAGATLGLAAGTSGGRSSATRGAYTNVTVTSNAPADAAAAHENMPPFIGLNYIIKT